MKAKIVLLILILLWSFNISYAAKAQLGVYFDKDPIRIIYVDENSPAMRYGLKAQDIITKLNGQSMTTYELLGKTMDSIPAEKWFTIEVMRDGKPVEIKVKKEKFSSDIYNLKELVSEKGPFILINYSIVTDSYRFLVLSGTLINNTNTDWSNLYLTVDFFDSSGNKVASDDVLISAIDKSETITLGSYRHTARLLVENIKFKTVDVNFKKGEYPANYIFSLVSPISNPTTQFEDSNISISFNISKIDIGFSLQNKTNSPLKLDWNNVSYTDLSGTAIKVLHEGVRYIDQGQMLPPTTIPPNAKIKDLIQPVNRIYFDDSYSMWSHRDLLPKAPFAKSLKGRSIGIFMPVEINGKIHNYNFVFRIDNVEI
ncbi:PDZ domain-containing protein [Acetonema longum]|uniref:PDZ domain-containing protein n=1 Tax=Acetonema longum DSM 6540 TaxID=1009370 RepID=F7NEA4_9FIRM|nr:PDZ domain-containing protein [Acetonema longum]EGO65616.1 hypothetical protein ALO_01834 [Acetonema longum DSM 6540]